MRFNALMTLGIFLLLIGGALYYSYDVFAPPGGYKTSLMFGAAYLSRSITAAPGSTVSLIAWLHNVDPAFDPTDPAIVVLTIGQPIYLQTPNKDGVWGNYHAFGFLQPKATDVAGKAYFNITIQGNNGDVIQLRAQFPGNSQLQATTSLAPVSITISTTPTPNTVNPVNLMIHKTGSGQVDPAEGTYTVNASSVQTFTATPDNGASFTCFIVSPGTNHTENPMTLTINQETTVTAVFTVIPGSEKTPTTTSYTGYVSTGGMLLIAGFVVLVMGVSKKPKRNKT